MGFEGQVGRADIFAKVLDPLVLVRDRGVLGARKVPPTPALGDHRAFGASLVPYSSFSMGGLAQSGAGVVWSSWPVASATVLVTPCHSSHRPSLQHLFTLAVWSEVLRGRSSLSWGAQPRWGAAESCSPPACLGIAVVLDGQPQFASVQGAAHTQAQLQVLITQTQQHLLPRKVGTEHPERRFRSGRLRPPGLLPGRRRATEGSVGAGRVTGGLLPGAASSRLPARLPGCQVRALRASLQPPWSWGLGPGLPEVNASPSRRKEPSSQVLPGKESLVPF